MTRFFSSLSRTSASLFSGTVIAVTCFSAVPAGAMIVMSANSEIRPASAIPAVTELVAGCDPEFIIFFRSEPGEYGSCRHCIALAR